MKFPGSSTFIIHGTSGNKSTVAHSPFQRSLLYLKNELLPGFRRFFSISQYRLYGDYFIKPLSAVCAVYGTKAFNSTVNQNNCRNEQTWVFLTHS
jgi:hypothetical protein